MQLPNRIFTKLKKKKKKIKEKGTAYKLMQT